MTVPVFFFNHLNTENNPDKSAICLWMDQDNKVEKAEGLMLNIMINSTIQDMAEPKPNTGVVIWRMKPTSFFVRIFSAPGGFGNQEVWEQELGKF